MKQKKIPMRTCVATREKLPKQELLRIVKTESNIVIDETGKINGRGMYVKNDKELLKKIIDKKMLERNLKTEISEANLEEIKEQINSLKI